MNLDKNEDTCENNQDRFKYNNKPRNNEDILKKILQKENEALKLFKNKKIGENETLNSLISVLEMQRDRINFLEEGELKHL